MARVRVKRRKSQIRIRHKRRKKLAKLRQAYASATEAEKKVILKKVKKLSPRLSQEQFFKPLGE